MPIPYAQHHSLTTHGLGKSFGPRRICRDVSLEVATGESLAIVGPNGSGKSTMIKMIAGLIRPETGRVEHRHDGIEVRPDGWYRHLGLVSPDLALYEELTGLENLEFANEVGGWERPRRDFDALLDEFGLGGRGHDRVAAYSSGMKQRLKFAAALLKKPAVLLLDEPTITLDEEGSARVWAAVSSRPMILIIATNDAAEASRAERRLTMGETSGGSGRA